MRVIPVIDLLGGQVVRGIAGRRADYRPIVSQIAADARPATVARALVERFGFDTVYVADLDAIMYRQPDTAAWKEISGQGLKLWLDAGVSDRRSAWRGREALSAAGADFMLIVGLESLQDADELPVITKDWDFPIVSVDLKGGSLLTRTEEFKGVAPAHVAHTLVKVYGIDHLIVLDLEDVGCNRGTRTLELCREIHEAWPPSQRKEITLISGGGVRGVDDLRALADAGCDAALVASALHDGRLSREDIERAKEF
jgi:phosphoribosylformimino-5-aminoimidazole carboxamide ribotide isomerase